MSLYLVVKFLHMLAAIIATGTNATYGVLLSRAHRAPEHLRHVRDGVRALDRNVANPAYALLLITGLLLVWMGPLSMTTPWVSLSLILFVLAAGIGLVRLTPLTRRQSDALERHGPDSPQYKQLRRGINRASVVAGLIVLVIIYLMVAKPTLWGVSR
jgi:uncharacterized membrane protein